MCVCVLFKRISTLIQVRVIIDIHLWISMIIIVYIDIHVFLDGYPNPVQRFWCCRFLKVNKYLP